MTDQDTNEVPPRVTHSLTVTVTLKSIALGPAARVHLVIIMMSQFDLAKACKIPVVSEILLLLLVVSGSISRKFAFDGYTAPRKTNLKSRSSFVVSDTLLWVSLSTANKTH